MNSNRCYGVSIHLIIILTLVLSFSGCIGVESRTNLSINVPETIDVFDRDVKMLTIEITPLEADAKNIMVNISAPPKISLTDPHTYLQKYNKEFKKISKGKKEIISFNYSIMFPGEEYSLLLEVKADNANSTKREIKVNSMIPTPEWGIGEYWIVNKTGDSYGTHVQQVLRKESESGEDVYVVKDTIARETNGTYRLYYYTTRNLAHIKTEYYEDDIILGKMTESIDPPSLIYGFPLMVGKTWNWNGTVSGIGQTEIIGEVLGKEKISVQGENYDTFKIRIKYTYPLGTSDWYVWYSTDIRGVVREKGDLRMGGLIKEDAVELVQHGMPPNQPFNIQPALQNPQGWKMYVDGDKRFSFYYPGNWKEDKSLKDFIIVEDLKNYSGIVINIESIGKMTLDDYSKKVKSDIYTNYGKIYYENNITINGRKGYYYAIDLWKGGTDRTRIFIANENGYRVSIYSDFNEEILNSFIFKEPPVYTLLELK